MKTIFFQLIIALAICCAVVVQAVSGFGTDPAWRSGEEVNLVFGVTIGENNAEVYATGYSAVTGEGFLYYSGDRSNNQPMKLTPVGDKNYDVTISNDGSTVCVVGASGIFTGPSKYQFTPTKRSDFTRVVAQEVRSFGANGFAIVGRFTNTLGGETNGVAISNDLGVTWTTYGLGISKQKGFSARYGSFPTANTWYVTTGTWPFNNDGKLSSETALRVSGRLSVYLDAGDATSLITFMSARNLLGTYPGAIMKTTNGGTHFQKVLDSNGEYYFNQIDCFTSDYCFVAGENAKKAVILKTTDGGATWTNVMTLNGPFSLHSVRMISNTEAWVSGGHPSVGPFATKEITGTYYHTTDGGATWAVTSFNGYGYDMSFKNGVGAATAIFKKHTDIWYFE